MPSSSRARSPTPRVSACPRSVGPSAMMSPTPVPSGSADANGSWNTILHQVPVRLELLAREAGDVLRRRSGRHRHRPSPAPPRSGPGWTFRNPTRRPAPRSARGAPPGPRRAPRAPAGHGRRTGPPVRRRPCSAPSGPVRARACRGSRRGGEGAGSAPPRPAPSCSPACGSRSTSPGHAGLDELAVAHHHYPGPATSATTPKSWVMNITAVPCLPCSSLSRAEDLGPGWSRPARWWARRR